VTIRPFEASDGAYVGADARGYQFLLDYKDGRAPFPTVELRELFAGTRDATLFRDKIVLIGYIADSVKDPFYTPLSRSLEAGPSTAGVLVHAHAASQLLRVALDGDAPTIVLRHWLEWGWIAIWSIAGALVALLIRSPRRVALIALIGALALGVLAVSCFFAGLWLPLIPSMLAWLVAIAAMGTYMHYRETFERSMLMQIFSRFVSPELATFIWRRRAELEGERRLRPEQMIATALFADLAGFVSVAAVKTPDALLEWMNEYMGAVTETLMRHGALIRQYAGDQIVVFFGVPVARKTEAEIDRDAVTAVECALAIEATLCKLNRRWRAEGRTTMGVRIGIMTGPMVVGTLGNEVRSELTVEGDAVNMASRLESFDKQFCAPDPESPKPCAHSDCGQHIRAARQSLRHRAPWRDRAERQGGADERVSRDRIQGTTFEDV
jgi:adenylate cyclase